MRIKLRAFAKYTRSHIFLQTLLPPLTSRLISLGGDSNNIFTIENELETDVTFPKRNDKDFFVTFIGRMEELQKGIKRLKKVIKYVGKFNIKIKFNIIGTGKDSQILNGLSENVKILRQIDDQAKNNIISSSNLAIITSNLEPYPLVVLEFLTSGVPVIATPASGPSYILRKDPSFGKVVSFSAKSLSMSIINYYNEWVKDKELYFSRRKDLYYKARETFDSKKMLDSYRDMITLVASKN
jgi:glycosyltransferase involved in cell wall biosynthesis